ncbi:MAG: hypothetical protein PSN34_08920 [Urechidicola sp.]|nr:hypothetical protein [Urechidicola sp.]
MSWFKNSVSKKLKASSLVETLVATVLIVLMFAIASLTLNNIFGNAIKNNTDEINRHLNQLQYQYSHQLIQLPYFDTYRNWEIAIEKTGYNQSGFVQFKAFHTKHHKTITKRRYARSE